MIDAEAAILSSFWLTLSLWIVLYLGDYYLTLWGARLYYSGAQEHVVYEGSYELTPQFQNDVNNLRLVSARFVSYVVLSVAGISALWFLAAPSPDLQGVFLLAYGGLVFRQLAILIRHARNIALFRHMREHRGVSGATRYSHWLMLEVSSVEFLFSAIMLLAAFAVAGKLSLLGGALVLGVTALKHQRWSRKIAAQAKRELVRQ